MTESPAAARGWPAALARLAANDGFRGLSLGLIVLNALCMGAEAVPSLADPWGDWLFGVFAVSQAWFVFEIVVRLLAHWPRLRGFFADGWNTFDFAIVLLSLLPAVGGVALIARVLRVARLLRLVSGLGLLRGFVRGGLGRGAHLAAGAVIYALIAYCFALIGFHAFGAVLPEAWGHLAAALATVAALLVFQGGGALLELGAGGITFVAALWLLHAGLAWRLLRGLMRPEPRA
jgi:voltage-gated sodium channel